MLTKLFFLFTGFLLIGSCSDPKVRKRFNLDYVAPDEFMVQKQKELVIPDKFSLPSPTPSSENNNESTESVSTDNLTDTDKKFLKKAEN
jgi:hypothetical protein